MPRLKLENINYVVSGSRQKILNVDFSTSDGTKKQDVSFFTDNELGTYGVSNLSVAFGQSLDGINKNEHGFVFLSDPKIVIRAMFDAKDVALKSAVAEKINKENGKDDNKEDDGHIELYFPHLREDPLGFVQMENYSYGMTDKTVVGPVIRRTDLFERKIGSELSGTYSLPVWENYLNPYDKYGSGLHDPGNSENLIPTYLYTPLSNLYLKEVNILSSEYLDRHNLSALTENELLMIENEAKKKVNSYFEWLSSTGNINESLSNLFKPVYNYVNVNHNYIAEIPLIKTNKLIYNDNQYSRGIVNSDMIMAKNSFDDLYDMNVSSLTSFARIREYQGINVGGKRLFLTYFDDVVVSADNVKKDLTYEDSDKNGPSEVKVTTDENAHKTRDYQKIECIDAINRFISTTKHKANVYSARVYGLDNVLGSKYSDEAKEHIKNDIRNSISRIVSNFVPAHTQFIGVSSFDRKEWTEQQC